MGAFTDLTNKRFNRLFVIKRVGISTSKKILWLCHCNCGREKTFSSGDLKSGRTGSCGCLRNEIAKKINTTHGDSKKHKLYWVWSSIKARCLNPNNKGFKNYGMRGIKICNKWINNYLSFKTWALNNGYKNGLEIDRIDNNGNYEPLNCRWTTRKISNLNKRSNRIYRKNDKIMPLVSWAREIKMNYYTLWDRVERQKLPFNVAISKPIGER